MRVLGDILGGSRAVLDPNMAPTWAPRWSQNRTKNDTKIDHCMYTFKSAILNDFCGIFGGKLEPSWGQDRVNTRSYLEVCEKRKTIVKQLKFQ